MKSIRGNAGSEPAVSEQPHQQNSNDRQAEPHTEEQVAGLTLQAGVDLSSTVPMIDYAPPLTANPLAVISNLNTQMRLV